MGRPAQLRAHWVLLAKSVDPNASYLAVVPAYNEARTVGRVVRAIRDRAPGLDVVVVDDGSTDGTGQVAEDSGARVLRHPFNLGIGGAVQTGFVYALDNGYDYMVQVDGDGQHDPDEIPKLIAAMQRGPDSRHGLRLALHLRPRLPGPDTAGARASTSSPSCSRASRAAASAIPPRASGSSTAAHRALRPRLPARLPRGGGGADGPPPPAAYARGAGANVQTRRRRLLDQLGQVRLLHGQGPAGPLRRPRAGRPVPEPGDDAPVAAGQGI